MTESIYRSNNIIYKITNTENDKSYIGKTTKGISIRWKQHQRKAKSVVNNNHFSNAIRKYNNDVWLCEVLFYSSHQNLSHEEIYFIKLYDTYASGYNSTIGGEGIVGYKPPKEKGMLQSIRYTGVNNPFYGRTHTPENIRHFSDIKLGTNNPMYNRKHSDKTKCLMSKRAKGENSVHFNGYYITPYGTFPSVLQAFDTAKSLSIVGLNKSNIKKWCEMSSTRITNIGNSKFLTKIDIGKTFGDLGFDKITTYH